MDSYFPMRPASVFLALCVCSLGFGAQEGFRVVAGDAKLEGGGVRSGGRAIVEWDRFSVESGERFSFMQAGPDSAVLNRVVGGDVSRIYGELHSNGQVYLVNRNGVFIGPEGRVNTAGFV
ncbi:MAG TPA: filamentous hemagglutinin N-terminal domain-containing protein, partial [Chlamydiales bacterium]|nr:filamentous hemagglutinin N-terminal domain-containing protein [Chlamydiales bacterium]